MKKQNNEMIDSNKLADNTRPDDTLRVTFTIEAVGGGRQVIDLRNVVFEISEFYCSGSDFSGVEVFRQCFDLLVKRPAENAVARVMREVLEEEIRKERARAFAAEDQVRTFADLNVPLDKPEDAAKEPEAKAA